MSMRTTVGELSIDNALLALVADELTPGTGITPEHFWGSFQALVADLAPLNRELLARRDALQAQLDDWHAQRKGVEHDAVAYKSFLQEIGYLRDEGAPFRVTTEGVDAEIATMAGP